MINLEELKKLIDSKFNSNYSAFAKEIGVNVSTISKIMNLKSEPGIIFFKKFTNYCKIKKINIKKYIFLQ